VSLGRRRTSPGRGRSAPWHSPPVAEPDDVLLVHIHRVRPWPVAGQPPRAPHIGFRIVAADVARVPLADPDLPLRVRPDAPGALVGGGRLDDRRLPGVEVDLRDMAAGEGGVVDGAVRRRRDPVRATATRCIEDPQVTGLRIEASVDPALSREPQDTPGVECCGVEVDVAAALGSGKRLTAAVRGSRGRWRSGHHP
jgi:hypothetical protein